MLRKGAPTLFSSIEGKLLIFSLVLLVAMFDAFETTEIHS